MAKDSAEPSLVILPVSPHADARARRFEREVRQLRSREDGLIIANATGQAVGNRIRGERLRIAFTESQLQAMRGNVISHNHPDGWSFPESDPRHAGASFSITDVRLMIEWELAEIRAVTPHYLYRLRPSQTLDSVFNRAIKVASTHKLQTQLRRGFLDVQIDLDYQVEAGRISSTQADASLPHEAMLKLMQKWGVEYEREEIP